jgi:DNA-binding SARP family transcriptional activator/tetratricopeptide (TPR) repeat protein
VLNTDPDGNGGNVPHKDDNGLRVAVLGPVRAFLEGRELALGPARQRTVFAVLAANASRVVGRDELIEAVWGAAAPSTATGSIYTYISGLRRALEPQRSPWSAADVLTSGSAGYSLLLDEDGLDAADFVRLRAHAQHRLAETDRAGAVAALDDALGLWHGEAFAGVAGPFVELERQRLADMRLATIEQRARILLDLGGHDDLVAELTGLVHDHPLDESLHELLMQALHRSGRHAESLAAYRSARQTLVRELGVEPGPALRRLHRQILDGTADPADPAPRPARRTAAATSALSVLPAHVARAVQDGFDARTFVGRAAEVTLLRELVHEVGTGHGRSVWIEGDPGIGKTELLTMALGDAGDRGCQLAWSTADQLGQRIPLQAVMDCLGLDPAATDPRRAALARELHAEPAGGDWGGSQSATAEKLVAFVRELCTTAPLILVIDDLQWADDASVLLWGRLAAATRQLPLLLVASTRPEPSRRELAQLRRGVEARRGHILQLQPLTAPDVETLMGQIVGGRPGATLRALAPRTAGNPLYAREMASSLIRQSAVNIVDGTAEVDLTAADEAPQSLLAAVRGTLDFLSADTQDVLRNAALLGNEFAVADVAALTGRSPYELVRTFDEAVTAHVIVDAETQLAFRHPFLRQALYEGIPRSLRATLRRHAAQSLAQAGAPVTRVAEQLAAEATVVDPWVVQWLTRHHAAVIHRAPVLAGELIRQVLDSGLAGPDEHAILLVALVKLLFRLDRSPEAEAQQAVKIATDPADRAEMRQLLAAMRFRRGDPDGAIQGLTQALQAPDVPQIWRVRHRALLANFRRGDMSDLDRAEQNAHRVHAAAVAERQPYAIAHALQTLWLISSIRRDHERALSYVDRALQVAGQHDYVDGLHSELVGLYLDLLDNRIFSLQNLDRLDEAEATLRSVGAVSEEHREPASLQVAAAVQGYWAARWDDALGELGTVTQDAPGITFHGMREPGAAALLMHGVAALIAARRDDRASALVHLDAAEAQFMTSSAERESCDFLVFARALVAEQEGRPGEALTVLTPILRPAYAAMMLRHQWLPEVVRLALDANELDIAHEALAVCSEEAAKETVPARAFAAAARCRALVLGDPDQALAAVAHYRSVGRRLELAATAEDAAYLLARAGRRDEAATAFDEAIRIFTELGARWDIRRAESRLRSFGITATAMAASRPGAR